MDLKVLAEMGPINLHVKGRNLLPRRSPSRGQAVVWVLGCGEGKERS